MIYSINDENDKQRQYICCCCCWKAENVFREYVCEIQLMWRNWLYERASMEDGDIIFKPYVTHPPPPLLWRMDWYCATCPLIPITAGIAQWPTPHPFIGWHCDHYSYNYDILMMMEVITAMPGRRLWRWGKPNDDSGRHWWEGKPNNLGTFPLDGLIGLCQYQHVPLPTVLPALTWPTAQLWPVTWNVHLLAPDPIPIGSPDCPGHSGGQDGFSVPLPTALWCPALTDERFLII